MKYIMLFIVSMYVQCVFSQVTDSDMVLIPACQFLMGKNSDEPSDFSPAHTVAIDSFLIDKYEVTNAEYKRFCDVTRKRLPEFWNQEVFKSGDKYLDYPVVGISWSDAEKFAKWKGKRLPSEAEWECAARGGLVNREYPNGDSLERKISRNDIGRWSNLIERVGKHKSNRFGLYDMDGNVWEWVADQYAENYYRSSPVNNPIGPIDKSNRVVRGGSWHSGASCLKVYYRKNLPSSWIDFAVGFRCAKGIGKKD